MSDFIKKIRPVGAQLCYAYERTDRQTHRHNAR